MSLNQVAGSIFFVLVVFLAALIYFYLREKRGTRVVSAALDGMSGGVILVGLKNQVLYLNPAAEKLLGRPASALVGAPADQAFAQVPFLLDILQNQEVPFQNPIQMMSGENLAYYSVSVNHLFDHKSKKLGKMMLIEDVTDRVLIELASREYQEKQRQVEQALERRASQLAILNDIGEKIAALMDLNGVLDSATHLIQTKFGYYHVALWLPDPGQKELVMRSSSGAFSSIFPENHRLKFGQGMVGWVADHGTLLLSGDVRKEARYTNFFPDKILTRSELSVPILLGEELVGVLDIQSPLINAFDDNDLRVMKTIADQLAIAIENARLYQQVLSQLKETERKENMLRIQRDLVVAISSVNTVQGMLDVALKNLSIELNVQRAAIFLLEADCGCLQPAASIGYTPEGLDQAYPFEQSVAGWVARTGQPTLVGDILEAPGYTNPNSDTRSVVCAPMISGGDVSGVILLESPQPNAFYSDDLRLLVILANNLVVLIERARIIQEVEKARAELETRASDLESANVRLRELDRIKSQFLANMSHELRTPLNSVIGFSEILLDNLAGPLNDDQADCVNNINVSGKHLLALINDLLDFSKIEAGRLTIEAEPFSVAKMFDELRATFQPLAEKKAQLLSMRVDPDLPMLTADRMRIKQVLINLFSNANKFTPPGGTITATCQMDGPDHMLFMMQDNGIGIQPEYHEVIFEEFRQVDGSMTREVAGTGLGLAISKRIVLLHQGEIWVKSELGQGACFLVRLPLNYQADML